MQKNTYSIQSDGSAEPAYDTSVFFVTLVFATSGLRICGGYEIDESWALFVCVTNIIAAIKTIQVETIIRCILIVYCRICLSLKLKFNNANKIVSFAKCLSYFVLLPRLCLKVGVKWLKLIIASKQTKRHDTMRYIGKTFHCCLDKSASCL